MDESGGERSGEEGRGAGGRRGYEKGRAEVGQEWMQSPSMPAVQ